MKLTEVEVSDKLLEFRSRQSGFMDTSFDTISGTFTSLVVICCVCSTTPFKLDDKM